MLPAVSGLHPQSLAFTLVQLLDAFKPVRALGYQSSLLQERKDVSQLVLVGKVFDVSQKLSLGDPNERVFDSI